MNRLLKMFLFAFVALLIVSCGGNDSTVTTGTNRSVQYFPNMYESVGYETYQEADIFPGNVEAQKPVDGSVSRGWLPYDYEDNNDGYASAKANLKNPLPYTEANLETGAALYNIYCAICHGTKGDGQGHLVKTEKILGVPSYDAREITQGSIYHVMYYGINYMGSYASQTSIKERWQIAHHVDALTRDLKKQPRMEFVTEEKVVDHLPDSDNHSEGHDSDQIALENESTTEGH
ncbi:MAG: cytochrome c [Nonlabens sp.]|jgi:hypothetical protein|uniref:c-type cytochrome n=1 Tax=Nonlabens sp. TaxID=1888209 RepID=UPI003219A435